jgi:hypothetical protein
MPTTANASTTAPRTSASTALRSPTRALLMAGLAVAVSVLATP